jgi:hypothetical protein
MTAKICPGVSRLFHQSEMLVRRRSEFMTGQGVEERGGADKQKRRAAFR